MASGQNPRQHTSLPELLHRPHYRCFRAHQSSPMLRERANTPQQHCNTIGWSLGTSWVTKGPGLSNRTARQSHGESRTQFADRVTLQMTQRRALQWQCWCNDQLALCLGQTPRAANDRTSGRHVQLVKRCLTSHQHANAISCDLSTTSARKGGVETCLPTLLAQMVIDTARRRHGRSSR